MWEMTYDYDNLLEAFHKASKGKRGVPEVERYRKDLHRNIWQLSQQIESHTVPVGQYSYFTIKDPKERTICAASFPERVYHHALMNVYHDAFEIAQVEHSYATRPGKGTHKALHQTWKNNQTPGYWIKLDVLKFFDTVHHDSLKRQIKQYFLEPEVRRAFFQILDSYATTPGRGLPIGNLTSQYFANFYLSFLDRYVKAHLPMRAYVRYMDDVLIWVKGKDEIHQVIRQTKAYLHENMQQEWKPPVFNKVGFPIPFLGFLVDAESSIPNRRNRGKFAKKVEELSRQPEGEQLEKYWIYHQFYTYKANAYNKGATACCAAAAGTTTLTTAG